MTPDLSATDERAQAVAQIREDALAYNRAVGSYNRHLKNHRDRRGLHDLEYRRPLTDAGVMGGDPGAIDDAIDDLIAESYHDSALRRHPRQYPIHLEALEHLCVARHALLTTLEDVREIDAR